MEQSGTGGREQVNCCPNSRMRCTCGGEIGHPPFPGNDLLRNAFLMLPRH